MTPTTTQYHQMPVRLNTEHFGCSVRDAKAFIFYLFWCLTDYGIVVCPLDDHNKALEVSSDTMSCHVVFDAYGETLQTGGVCQDHRVIECAAQHWFSNQSDLKGTRL